MSGHLNSFYSSQHKISVMHTSLPDGNAGHLTQVTVRTWACMWSGSDALIDRHSTNCKCPRSFYLMWLKFKVVDKMSGTPPSPWVFTNSGVDRHLTNKPALQFLFNLIHWATRKVMFLLKISIQFVTQDNQADYRSIFLVVHPLLFQWISTLYLPQRTQQFSVIFLWGFPGMG